jgi:hypothetical protein
MKLSEIKIRHIFTDDMVGLVSDVFVDITQKDMLPIHLVIAEDKYK